MSAGTLTFIVVIILFSNTYDIKTSLSTSKQWQTKRHKGSCRGVEFSPDGNKLVSVGKDGGIKLADSETGKVVAKDMEAHG